jgi:hypothetical protein
MSLDTRLFLFAARCHYLKSQHPGRFDLNMGDLSTFDDDDEVDPSVGAVVQAPVVKLRDPTLFPTLRRYLAQGNYVIVKVDSSTKNTAWIIHTQPVRPPGAPHVPRDALAQCLLSVGSIVDGIRRRADDSSTTFAMLKEGFDATRWLPNTLPREVAIGVVGFVSVMDLFLVTQGRSDLEQETGLDRDVEAVDYATQHRARTERVQKAAPEEPRRAQVVENRTPTSPPASTQFDRPPPAAESGSSLVAFAVVIFVAMALIVAVAASQ